jgi:hypothetical protein
MWIRANLIDLNIEDDSSITDEFMFCLSSIAAAELASTIKLPILIRFKYEPDYETSKCRGVTCGGEEHSGQSELRSDGVTPFRVCFPYSSRTRSQRKWNCVGLMECSNLHGPEFVQSNHAVPLSH